MSTQAVNYNKKRLRSSNITVVVSIALVLFLIGLTGMILINTSNYFNYLKEKFVVEVFLKDFVDKKDESRVLQMQLDFKDTIAKKPYVKNADYISKEMAYQLAKIDLGPDNVELVEKNIFPASLQITLPSQYVDTTKLKAIKTDLTKYQIVESVKDDNDLMDVYNKINTILLYITGLAVLFLIIAIILINNSIRLKIFSKRFIIKTMQLVGAKRRFIMKPFIIQSMWLGLLGSLISILMLFGLWYYFTIYIGMPFIQDNQKYMLLIIGIIVLGVLITVISTFFATFKFLKLRTDDLYYS